ncbi:IS30 family transposase [Mycobacterium crocinum]|uniref:IS30 family transposase n=1 Tax=Mycolicibacterium crocinum TaxID=388459 RepID=A0ABY3TQ12_9MYCO|nr:IS30 family transposase [Mycolicibacterium crocinum]MCV7216329.1 IS30 family transposase [Mycolicibacterium crocinum]ULN41240.1 IS30 family transposase [Mycolicibacterium crocinum]ULN43327.1 IS30 family transposase [Mycolicibacterium crocinum]
MARLVLEAKKRLFWQRVREGLLPGDASEAAGVSATCGRRWFREAGGVKPAVSKLNTCGPRPRLTLEERIEIQAGVHANDSIRSIAGRLNRAPSTIKREIDNNTELRTRKNPKKSGYRRKDAFGARQSGSSAKVDYRALSAHDRSADRARRPKPSKLAGNDTLREQVQSRLESRHSPEQIALRLRFDFPDDPEMWVSHEAIYQALYVQGRGALRRELHQCLRTKRAIRRPQHQPGTRPGRIPNMINISERPADVNDRAVPGHWEGDLIMGSTASNSAIGTLVERATRFVMLLHLPDGHTAEAVQDAIVAKITELPEHLRLSLTWDQGKEMANHRAITEATDLDIYFCDPHSPWQRGSNENTNGLLRQYFPKGTDLSLWGPGYLDQVASELNGRPRKTLGWRTPAEALNELLSNPPTVASTP